VIPREYLHLRHLQQSRGKCRDVHILSRTHRFRHHHRRASTPIRAACGCGGRDGVQVLLLLLVILLGLAGGGADVGGVPDEHAVEKLDLVCGFGYHGELEGELTIVVRGVEDVALCAGGGRRDGEPARGVERRLGAAVAEAQDEQDVGRWYCACARALPQTCVRSPQRRELRRDTTTYASRIFRYKGRTNVVGVGDKFPDALAHAGIPHANNALRTARDDHVPLRVDGACIYRMHWRQRNLGITCTARHKKWKV
jgi:hypothetical protein